MPTAEPATDIPQAPIEEVVSDAMIVRAASRIIVTRARRPRSIRVGILVRALETAADRFERVDSA